MSVGSQSANGTTAGVLPRLSAFDIKTVAIAAMIVDHVGVYFLPDHVALRLVGRLAFPLFAWLIANGVRHSADPRRYLGRLLLFAVVSQVPFTLANRYIEAPLFYLNVLFTLSLGLVAIWAIRKLRSLLDRMMAVCALAVVADLLHCDYGDVGVLSIAAFYVFFDRKIPMAFAQAAIYVALPWAATTLAAAFGGHLSLWHGDIEYVAPLALVFVWLYDGRRGPKAKLFYAVYPAQYAVIAAAKLLLP